MSSWRVHDVVGVRTLVIDRPPVNALSMAALEELDVLIGEVKVDPTVRVVVITGAGTKFFVAGADIAEAAATPPERAGVRTGLGQRVMAALSDLPLPVLVAVNGLALGGGCEIALAADIRFASTTARFGQPEVKLGIMPGFGGTQRLARLIGMGRALDMLLSGHDISADEALSVGLVSEVVDPVDLPGRVAAYASDLTKFSPAALAAIKHAVRAGSQSDLAAGLDLEVALSNRLRLSPDAREGLQAFVEKRPPGFSQVREVTPDPAADTSG